METKECSKCKVEKSLELFSKHSKTKDGYNYQCKECMSIYYKENSDRIKRNSKEWSEKNIDKRREINNKYARNNKDKRGKYRATYEKERYKKDSLYRFKRNISSLINKTIRDRGLTKNKNTLSILGCSVDFLLDYISNQFSEDMNWNNYGEWEIDHIYPVSRASTEEEILSLNHYSNLRPLWRVENRKKLDKIEELQLKFL